MSRCATCRRRLIVMSLAVLAFAGTSALAQDLPPPVQQKKNVRPIQPKGGATAGQAAAGQQQAPSPVLLVTTDLPCAFTVDGGRATPLTPTENKRITVDLGQHLVACSDGTRIWQLVVDAKPGQQVVQVALATAGRIFSADEFDKTMARAYMGISDLKVAGAYAAAILQKAWGFHNQSLSTALHTAHAYLKLQVDEMVKMAPTDPERKRMSEDVTRVAETATKYIELMTKAISDAQKSNSWQGEPGNLYAQARALEPSLAFPQTGLGTMKTSASFKAELPVDRQVDLGLVSDARDFDLGALYYQSSPTILAVVVKGGAADKMGFRSGDRILSVGGQSVDSVWQLKIGLRAAGKKARVVYEREGRQQDREVSPLFR